VLWYWFLAMEVSMPLLIAFILAISNPKKI